MRFDPQMSEWGNPAEAIPSSTNVEANAGN